MKNQHSTNLNFTERTRKRQYTTKNQITVIVGRLKLMACCCKNFKKLKPNRKNNKEQKATKQDFPDGPVVKTPHPSAGGRGSIPDQGRCHMVEPNRKESNEIKNKKLKRKKKQ